jgi:hypothetical protein
MLSVAFYSLLRWMLLWWVSHFIHCYYDECRILFIVIMMSVAFYLLLCWMLLCWVSHFIECYYAECRILFTVMLNVIMLRVAFYLVLCWMLLCWVSHFIYFNAECYYAECRILFIIMLSVLAPFSFLLFFLPVSAAAARLEPSTLGWRGEYSTTVLQLNTGSLNFQVKKMLSKFDLTVKNETDLDLIIAKTRWFFSGDFSPMRNVHRHLRIKDCLTAHTACLVCFISTVNGHCNKKEKKRRSLPSEGRR